MSVTITLDDEIAERLQREADAQQRPVEEVALDILDEALEKGPPLPAEQDGKTLADLLAPHIGILDSGEYVPGGAQMSEDTGRKFAEGMKKKRREGRL